MYVSPKYFPVFERPILRGRNFTAEEAKGGAPVVVISQATARQFWPGRDALGHSLRIEQDPQQHNLAENRRIGIPAPRVVNIIGIARDAVNGYVGCGIDQTCVFFPARADGAGYGLLVRMKGDAEIVLVTLDKAIAASIPGPVDEIHPMAEALTSQLYPYRAASWVSSAIGGIALLLTLSGIYSVLSDLVTQRTKEIGIRVALGASSGSVVRLVLKQSLKLVGIGAAVGARAAFGVFRILASHLEVFVFDKVDTVALKVGIALVIGASACAAYFPCLRAVRIEPATTLRCD
jgi:hypothetical protein